jgi:hypothetical protein
VSDTITSKLTSEEAELKAAIDNLFAEIELKHQQMKRDREDFQQSLTRTREILASLRAA